MSASYTLIEEETRKPEEKLLEMQSVFQSQNGSEKQSKKASMSGEIVFTPGRLDKALKKADKLIEKHENQPQELPRVKVSTDDWLTPPIIADAFECFGGVGLDPCSHVCSIVVPKLAFGSSPEDPKNLRLKKVYNQNDGLQITWDNKGLVYINPPYSDPAPWVEKAAKKGDECILLLPASTGEAWWHKWVVPSNRVLFWKGRLTFYEPDGIGAARPAKYPARFSSVLVYWGTRVELFEETFKGCGWFVGG